VEVRSRSRNYTALHGTTLHYTARNLLLEAHELSAQLSSVLRCKGVCGVCVGCVGCAGALEAREGYLSLPGGGAQATVHPTADDMRTHRYHEIHSGLLPMCTVLTTVTEMCNCCGRMGMSPQNSFIAVSLISRVKSDFLT
jgi:hypothetical protein